MQIYSSFIRPAVVAFNKSFTRRRLPLPPPSSVLVLLNLCVAKEIRPDWRVGAPTLAWATIVDDAARNDDLHFEILAFREPMPSKIASGSNSYQSGLICHWADPERAEWTTPCLVRAAFAPKWLTTYQPIVIQGAPKLWRQNNISTMITFLPGGSAAGLDRKLESTSRAVLIDGAAPAMLNQQPFESAAVLGVSSTLVGLDRAARNEVMTAYLATIDISIARACLPLYAMRISLFAKALNALFVAVPFVVPNALLYTSQSGAILKRLRNILLQRVNASDTACLDAITVESPSHT